MKDTIYTIPITDVFQPKCGCPLCALYNSLETRWVEYITGAAMMEPDIRIETNRQGFCSRHFDQMLLQRNRLSVALILQTRLAYLDEHLESLIPKPASRFGRKPEPAGDHSCFVCGKIDGEFARITDNLLVLWGRDTEFRALFAQQDFLCLPHFQVLAGAARGKLKGKDAQDFLEASLSLARGQLRALKDDIDAFCQLFDYRNAGGQRPDERVATSIERSIAFLTASPFPDGEEPSY